MESLLDIKLMKVVNKPFCYGHPMYGSNSMEGGVSRADSIKVAVRLLIIHAFLGERNHSLSAKVIVIRCIGLPVHIYV